MQFPDVGGAKGGVNKENMIKLGDKGKIQGVFRGDPKIFRTHWNDKFSEQCPGKDKCARCQAGEKAKFRFRINFITRQDGQWIAKVFENSYATYQDMKALHESDYNLEETCVTISRTGSGLNDTRYQILPAKNNAGLKPEDFRAMFAVKLHELSGQETQSEEPEGDANEQDVPF